MLEYLHLRNVGPAPEMELNLAPRLNLLTGDNGLGKSFLLDIAWWALTRRWPAELNSRLVTGRMARPQSDPASIRFKIAGKRTEYRHKHSIVGRDTYPARFERRQQAWIGSPGRPCNPGLVIYALVDGSFAIWDPARNYWETRGGVDVQDRPPAYVFSPQEVWDGLPLEPGPKLCNGLVSDWAGWQKERGEAFQHLKAVLESLSPVSATRLSSEERDAQVVLRHLSEETLAPGVLTRVSLDDVRDMPTLRMPYERDVPVVEASAGIRRIIALAYLLVWCWQEHVQASKLLKQPAATQIVFLIDEVEAHLHPRWQRTILRSLLTVMDVLSPSAEVQLIAATHSPLVMASVEPHFDQQRDAWFDLDLIPGGSTGRVELRQRDFVRHGDVSQWLTSEAFDLGEPTSVEAEAAIRDALSLLAMDSPTQADLDRVDKLLRDSLSDVDRFWVRWSQFKRSVGNGV